LKELLGLNGDVWLAEAAAESQSILANDEHAQAVGQAEGRRCASSKIDAN